MTFPGRIPLRELNTGGHRGRDPDVTSGRGTPLLRLERLGKRFGPVHALRGVDLSVYQREIVGVIGDNGAGKSTLIKLVSGALQPTYGAIQINGEHVRLRSTADAMRQGISAIYQELALAPRLSVWENVFMGDELVRSGLLGFGLVDRRRMRIEAADYFARMRIDMPHVDTPVERLSGGQRQAVAIARALRWKARLAVFDEPTASLGARERAFVLALIRSMRDAGVTVLLVSHNLDDILRLTDRYTVLRYGAKVAEGHTADADVEQLTELVLTSNDPRAGDRVADGG